MKFKSIVWSSTIDYPDEVSTVLFVDTCNWDCEYCYNKKLKENPDIDFKTQILPGLLNRKDFINHVVISGGECTLCPELKETINILKENGFKVGIHTNGSNIDVLESILPKIDFIGMDIKTNPMLYSDYKITPSVEDDCNVYNSIRLILDSGIDSEFRTTLYPKYCSLDNCVSMAEELNKMGVKQLVLQEYTNEFDKSLIDPFDKSYIQSIIDQCNKIIPTKLKGENT